MNQLDLLMNLHSERYLIWKIAEYQYRILQFKQIERKLNRGLIDSREIIQCIIQSKIECMNEAIKATTPIRERISKRIENKSPLEVIK